MQPDIIPPPRKSIRDVPLPQGRQSSTFSETEKSILEQKAQVPSYDSVDENYPPRKDVTERGPRKLLWTIVIALILGVVLSIFLLYSKASLAIVTKNETIPVNLVATSTKDGREGTIPYSIITLNKDDNVELNGTIGTKQVEKKASGTITIYNNYSVSSQSLIATTRFETKDGLVYRINKDVTVPGQTIQNGQTIPGSVDAVVVADASGPKYNIGKVDFTIPGFQGTPKYAGFYAKSKTDMTGGYIGNETTVSDAEMSFKTAALKASLEQALLAEVKTETPETFVFFPQGMVVNLTTTTEVVNGKTMLKGRATALATIFNKTIITNEVNKMNNTNYKVLDGFENLQADIKNTAGLASGDFPDLQLSLQGNLTVGQEIIIGELQRQLAGKSKNDLNTIMSTYSSVKSANVRITPFWRTHFPNNPKKIEIVLTKAI